MVAVAACALAEAANVDRVARTGEPGKKLLEMFKVFGLTGASHRMRAHARGALAAVAV